MDNPEHCVVLIGYDLDAGTVTISDPVRGMVTRNLNTVASRYEQMHSQAVVIKPNQKVVEPVTQPVTEKSTEKVTEPVTQPVTEKSTEKATETTTQKTTETTTQVAENTSGVSTK